MFVQPVLSLRISKWLKLPLTFIVQILPRWLKPAHHEKVLSKGANWAHMKSQFHFDVERWMNLIREREYASALFFCCILSGIPEHVFLSISTSLSVFLSRGIGEGWTVCVWGWRSWYWGLVWVITRSVSSGQEKKGGKIGPDLLRLQFPFACIFYWKPIAVSLAWRWIAALELRFNQ